MTFDLRLGGSATPLDVVRQNMYLVPILFVVLYVLHQRFFSQLANIPGPLWASLSRTWITHHSWNGDMHRVMIKLHEKHGKVVRVAPNEVVANLEAIKKIYGAGSKFRKSDWYSVFQGRRKFDLFAERDETVHAKQRRLVSRAYSMESLKDFEIYVDDAIKVLFQRLEERKEKPIDVGNWAQLFAFDVIGEVTFSKRFGFMDVGADDGSFKQIETALRSAAWIGQIPWLYWLNDYLIPILGNHLGINARHGSLRNFAATEINARKDRGSDHQDILSKLFAVHDEKPEDFDDAAVVSMASSNIFAGSDTTAISIRAILYYLLKNPQYKARLVRELDILKADGRLNDLVSLEEANNIPYLQAVMYEALRLHPAVGMSLPRVVPEGGMEIDGHYLPAGTVVGANPWVVHRNKEVYGHDAESFRPDRWLVKDASDMHRFFFAFGSGARTCLGRNISWLEISKLIPSLFLRYDIDLVDPAASWRERCWWFVTQQGLIVTLGRRV